MRRNPANSLALIAAGGWALAELILGLTVGGFVEAGRAETVAFLTVRPFLLILAPLLAVRWPWRQRAAFYCLGLLAAGAGETLLVARLGAPGPWTGMLLAFGASLLLLVPVDFGLQLIRRRLANAWARALAMALFVGAVIVLAPRAPWESLLGPADGPPAAQRPRLLLMTSLPIVWGEYGAFDARSRPSKTYELLREEFDVEPIDSLDAGSMGSAGLLLLAQPRWLSPSELVLLDDWVRRGGRAVILADPDLRWPSDLPLGDVRRPLRSTLLSPLFSHWGLKLEPAGPRPETEYHLSERGRRFVLDSPGSFSGRLHARLSIGKGRAILVADADVVRDDLWVAPGSDGDARHRRLADNPLYLADLLDEAAGMRRERVRAPVVWWKVRGPSLIPSLPIAFLPTFLLFAAGLLSALLGRLRPQTYPQAYKG